MTVDSIVVDAGRVDAVHRLALAVQAIDALTRTPVQDGVRVARETVRAKRGGPGFTDHGRSLFVLTHRPDTSADAVVRLTDPDRRFVPRRLTVRLWPLAAVTGIDQRPPTAPFVPATSRLLRPWLLPGAAAVLPRGTTGLRTRITRAGRPVRWARVELFTAAGRIGWGHADERGEVVVVASRRAAYPAAGTLTFPTALRVHRPAIAVDPDPDDPLADPLADLVVEQILRSAAPPTTNDLDNARLRGISRPTGYVTAPDQVITLTSGRVSVPGDITI
jgi:hypothetical protein